MFFLLFFIVVLSTNIYWASLDFEEYISAFNCKEDWIISAIMWLWAFLGIECLFFYFNH
jgi:hypothetical protein